ncbi:MAG: CHC2 zinc finger domain-containing protein [Chloroflexi bacterium]|nr:CHC2 zinc finger domain-containing protein [Chloroflexota bacterium]
MTRLDVESVKRGNPIAAVVQHHGIELRRSGKHLGGRCPFHEDRSPSLAVYPETESFHCFGCGAGGDVIDFVRRASGLGFREALERLGVGSPSPVPTRSPARPPESRERALALSLDDRLTLTAACELYHEALLEAPEALRYLEGRGIPPWLVRRRRLGLAEGRRLLPYLKRRRLSLRRAREIGLLRQDGSETLAGRIVIPDLRGGYCGWMVGRALSGALAPKYRGLALPRPLLGYEPGRRRLFVTEGPFDWLTLVSWGLPACALLGTQPGRGAMRVLGRARSVVLVLDADEPGRRAAAELAAALGSRARVLELSGGVKDVSELGAQPDGRETFFRLLGAERAPRAGMQGGADGA